MRSIVTGMTSYSHPGGFDSVVDPLGTEYEKQKQFLEPDCESVLPLGRTRDV